MIARCIEEVRKPIIYIALSLFFGSLCHGVYEEWIGGAIFIASLFLLCIAINTNIIFSMAMSIFLAIGILINIAYYAPNISREFKGEVRIVEDSGYDVIGEIKGRRVYLESKNLECKLGDILFIEGKYADEKNIEKGIIGEIEVSTFKVLDSGLIGNLYELREEIYIKLKDNIGERKAGMVASLAFGYSNYLDTADKDEMRSLGIIHAISVSGLHVAIIFAIASKLIGGKLALILTGIYVVFTGAPISSIRAFIMILCLSQAISLRKKYNPLAGLALSLIILILIKPYCIFQIGFLLSYAATLGIILFVDKLNKLMFKLPKYIRETLSLSLASQVFTLPILIFAFEEFSMWFIIGNLLVIPILNILIILGNSLVIAIALPSVFNFISFIILKFVNIVDKLMDLLYDVTNSSFIVNKSTGFFIIVITISIYFILKGYKKFYFLPVAAIIAIGLNIYSPIPRIDYLRQGAILISYRGERQLITNKRNINVSKLKKVTLANDVVLEGKKIKVSNISIIEAEGKNFIMSYNNNKYLLRMNRYGEISDEYDIIDFVDGNITGFFLGQKKLVFIK